MKGLDTAATTTTADFPCQENLDVLSVENKIASDILDICFEIHRKYGPGLLESAYEKILAFDLVRKKNLKVEVQKTLPLLHDGLSLDAGYRLDMIVHDKVIVELKCVEKIMPIHEAQIITYLRLSGRRLGLIINFNEKLLKNGIRRIAL